MGRKYSVWIWGCCHDDQRYKKLLEGINYTVKSWWFAEEDETEFILPSREEAEKVINIFKSNKIYKDAKIHPTKCNECEKRMTLCKHEHDVN